MGPGWVPPARSGRERERQRHGAHPPTPTRTRGAPPGGTVGGSPLRGGPQLRFWALTLEKSGASLSGAAAGAVPAPPGGRMAAACRCSRCAARQPERRRPPRSFSFRRIIREYCQNTARKEKIRGYVRYRCRQCRSQPSHGGAQQCFLRARCPARLQHRALLTERRNTRSSAPLSPQQRPRAAPRHLFTAQRRAAAQHSAAAVPPRCPRLPPRSHPSAPNKRPRSYF